MSGFSAILSDPPWAFRDAARSGERGAGFKYPTMSVRQIAALPVQSLAADDCALFLWVPSSLLVEGAAAVVCRAWGFTPKTVAFVWRKLSPSGDSAHMGMGHWTRQDAELCVLAVRGHPKVASHAVRQVIEAPVREHSRKPDEQYARIETLMGAVPRIELFARYAWPGWSRWGLEAPRGEGLLKTRRMA